MVPYFFGCKTDFFFPKQSEKNLDPSYKMDIDLWDCLGRVKTCIIAKFHKTDLAICSYSREGKTPSHSRINMVCFILGILEMFIPALSSTCQTASLRNMNKNYTRRI